MNPLSFLAYALAAGKGRVDDVPAAAWAAAGFTLLQRSVTLVRALAGRRSGILLPPSGSVVTAIAASDGRGALLVPQMVPPEELSWWLEQYDVGAVFTTRALVSQLPETTGVIVLLDDAPRSATVVASQVEHRVDLGSHVGLELEGEEDDGSLDECLISTVGGGVTFSHRAVLASARGAVDATSLIARDRVLAVQPPWALAEFALTLAGPLLASATVRTCWPSAPQSLLARLRDDRITVMAADAATYGALLGAIDDGVPTGELVLRVCTVTGPRPDAALQARWLTATGVELRHAFGVAELPLALYNAPHFPNRRGTLGVPFPAVQADVRPASTAARTGAPQVLWVRSAALGTPRATAGNAPTIHRAADDGWIDTGVSVSGRADGAFELRED